jgi:hypothetical protein
MDCSVPEKNWITYGKEKLTSNDKRKFDTSDRTEHLIELKYEYNAKMHKDMA